MKIGKSVDVELCDLVWLDTYKINWDASKKLVEKKYWGKIDKLIWNTIGLVIGNLNSNIHNGNRENSIR